MVARRVPLLELIAPQELEQIPERPALNEQMSRCPLPSRRLPVPSRSTGTVGEGLPSTPPWAISRKGRATRRSPANQYSAWQEMPNRSHINI
jgi:hypothetical protein